jgi:hypothetical protein
MVQHTADSRTDCEYGIGERFEPRRGDKSEVIFWNLLQETEENHEKLNQDSMCPGPVGTTYRSTDP